MKLLQNPKVILPFIFILSFLMHFHVFTVDLVGYHVWRQTQTQNNIENFYKEDLNILHPKTNDRGDGNGIQRQEFPIMQWLFACFYKLFGDHLIISRILSFLIGLLSTLGIFFLLKNIFQKNSVALIGAWAFTFSPVFYYYTLNPLPDNFALCCSIWGISFFFGWINEKTISKIILVALLLSLGALAKLPFCLYASLPLAYFILERKNREKNLLPFLILFSAMMVPLVWYIKVIPSMQGNPVVFGMAGEQHLSFNEIFDILQFNLISSLPELLVNYGSMIFFLAGFYFVYKNKTYKSNYFKLLCTLGIFVLLYFFFEMNAIAKVHDYYLFPFLPLIFIAVSYGCFYLLNRPNIFLQRFSIVLLLILPVTAFIRADTRWNTEKPGFNPDLLVYKKELRAAVPDSALCIAGNDDSKNIFFYYIRKKGWGFGNNALDSATVKTMIAKGAGYLYSDSRETDEKREIKQFLDSLLLQKGSIRVYKLKKK